MKLLKRVTQIVMVIVFTLAICVCITACDEKENNSEKISEKIAATKLPENEIIFINRYQNWASGYVDRGYFVDSDGAAYAFDFSQYTYDIQEGEEVFLDKLWIIRDITEPFATVDINVLKEVYYYGMEIDTKAAYSEETMGCDIGQRSLVFRNTDTDECTVFYEEGDIRRKLQDTSAQQLISIYEEQMKDNLIVKDYPYMDTYSALTSFECGYVENEGKYIIFNEEQLHHVEEYTGYTKLFDTNSENIDFDEYVYLVEFENVPSTGYDLKASAIMYYDGAFDFLDSSDSVYPGEDDMVGEMMGGFCFVAAFPKAEFPYSEYGYKDFSGGNWIVLEE